MLEPHPPPTVPRTELVWCTINCAPCRCTPGTGSFDSTVLHAVPLKISLRREIRYLKLICIHQKAYCCTNVLWSQQTAHTHTHTHTHTNKHTHTHTEIQREYCNTPCHVTRSISKPRIRYSSNSFAQKNSGQRRLQSRTSTKYTCTISNPKHCSFIAFKPPLVNTFVDLHLVPHTSETFCLDWS